jgi:rfaE bifunctional protein nucleotidyltransferase chain/domain
MVSPSTVPGMKPDADDTAGFLTWPETEAFVRSQRAVGRRVVFTNGVFDLLHPGHVRYLQHARSLGDLLIVGLNGDASVSRNKGPGRPITPERERAELLAALECVDAVVVFDQDTPADIVRLVRPDVLVKGADWPADQIVGRDTVEAGGGQVVLVPVEPGHSTSSIVERIRNAR